MANEIQRFYFRSAADPLAQSALISGSFRFAGFSAQFSGYINYNDNAAAVTAALEAFSGSSIPAGDVSVTDPSGNGFQYEFVNGLANTPINQFDPQNNTLRKNADTISINMLDNGVDPQNEQHAIDLGGATTGTFDLTDGSTTATVSSLDTTGIQAAYDTIYGSGQFVVVDQGGGIFVATAQGSGTWNDTSVTNNTTDGSPSAYESQPYVAGSGPIYEAWLPDEPDAGTLTLTYDVGGANTSAEFAWNASAGTIETAIANGGAGPGSTVTGSGTTADPWVIDLSSSLAAAATNPSYGTEGSTALTGPCAVEVVTVQEGSGGVNAESPTVLLDFLGVAPNTAKFFASGQGVLDFLAIAPLFSLTAVSGQGLIDFAATQPASSKLSAQPTALLDFLAPALTETITAPAPVVIVNWSAPQPVASKAASSPVVAVDFLAITPGSARDVALGTALLDIASVAPAASRSAATDPAMLDFTATAYTESLVAQPDPAVIEVLAVSPLASKVAASPAVALQVFGVAPLSSKAAASPPVALAISAIAPTVPLAAAQPTAAILFSSPLANVSRAAELQVGSIDFAAIAPATAKIAALPVGLVEFAAPDATAAYGTITLVAAHFYTLEPDAIDSLELTQASQAMTLDPRKATAFVLDTHITQAFSGDTRRVDAP